MAKVHVKTGDTVVLLTGKKEYKYDGKERKTGKVVEVSQKEGKVIVEGFNYVTKHIKPTRVGESGSIVKAEAPIYACKVQLVCPKCKQPTRVGHEKVKNERTDKNNVVRVCKKCGEKF
jgi:large subunit ribosomal protein L24